MTQSLAFPLAAAVVIAALAASVHRRLPPRLATRFIVVSLGAIAVAAIPTVALVALAFLAHVPVVGLGFQWCAQAIGLHDSVPWWLGVVAVAVLVLGAARSIRLWREHRAFRVDVGRPPYVASDAVPFAVTLPGRAGQIVISSAMIEMLDEDEQRVVIAHERAHARYRHDRYVFVAQLAAAAIPPLRHLAQRVVYSVERWADEAAAAVCGDRQLVAVTLGKVALRANDVRAPGRAAWWGRGASSQFGGFGIASRMEALLAPPVHRPRVASIAAVWSSVLAVMVLSAYQLHHLERLVGALCPH